MKQSEIVLNKTFINLWKRPWIFWKTLTQNLRSRALTDNQNIDNFAFEFKRNASSVQLIEKFYYFCLIRRVNYEPIPLKKVLLLNRFLPLGHNIYIPNTRWNNTLLLPLVVSYWRWTKGQIFPKIKSFWVGLVYN